MMLGAFASLYPLYRPALGVSECEHAVRPYTLVSPFGACRGAQHSAAECCEGLGC